MRSEFTRALLMPRTTSNWQAPIARNRRDVANNTPFSEAVLAARQRLRRALDRSARNSQACCSIFVAFSSAWKTSSGNAPGRRAPPKLFCSSGSIALLAITVMAPKRKAAQRQNYERGARVRRMLLSKANDKTRLRHFRQRGIRVRPYTLDH